MKTYTSKDIKRACQRVYGVTKKEFESSSRLQRIAHCRFTAMWFMRHAGRPARRSWPAIAQTMGFKTHHTAMHGVKKWDAQIDANDAVLIYVLRVVKLVLDSPELPDMPDRNLSGHLSNVSPARWSSSPRASSRA